MSNGRKCSHNKQEPLIEYEGLIVNRCTEGCGYIMQIKPHGAQKILYTDTQAHYKYAKTSSRAQLGKIDKFLKESLTETKYTFWRSMVGSIQWYFNIKRVEKWSYLSLHFIDPSMSRMKHEASNTNTHSSRNLGSIDNYPNKASGLFEAQALYTGWNKVVTWLEGVLRAKGDI